MLMNMGISGYANVGDDIGGFWGSPPAELLTRWLEIGAFNPIYRNHANKGTRFREPWVDGPEHEAMIGTVRNVGYRFVPVKGERAAAPPLSGGAALTLGARRPGLARPLIGGFVLAAVPVVHAVIPSTPAAPPAPETAE